MAPLHILAPAVVGQVLHLPHRARVDILRNLCQAVLHHNFTIPNHVTNHSHITSHNHITILEVIMLLVPHEYSMSLRGLPTCVWCVNQRHFDLFHLEHEL
jgi:hypothetical protein